MVLPQLPKLMTYHPPQKQAFKIKHRSVETAAVSRLFSIQISAVMVIQRVRLIAFNIRFHQVS
jgi:hypothetical protein